MTGGARVTITALANLNAKIEIQASRRSQANCHFGSKDSCHYHFGDHALRDIEVQEPSHRLSAPS
jgi:hypothetical protein